MFKVTEDKHKICHQSRKLANEEISKRMVETISNLFHINTYENLGEYKRIKHRNSLQINLETHQSGYPGTSASVKLLFTCQHNMEIF